MNIIRAYITVGNPKGVHGRVATRLAEIAREFELEITLAQSGETVDASSILDVLSMALVCGTFICVTLKGNRAAAGLPAVYNTLINDDHLI